MQIDRATELLWEAIHEGNFDPPALRGVLTIDDAHAILVGLLDRYLKAGERQAGWKVGLTAKAIQAQIGHHEPVFGFLLESGHLQSGTCLAFNELVRPKCENELCLTIGTTLRGPGVTFAQARAAVSHVAPAFEIVEQRQAAPLDAPLAVAERSQNRGFVTGNAIPLGDLDLSAATVDIVVNGEQQERAKGSEVLGDGPIASVAWLANKLAAYGRVLEAGALVMSGSFTRQYDLLPGHRVEARFEPVGTVKVSVQ